MAEEMAAVVVIEIMIVDALVHLEDVPLVLHHQNVQEVQRKMHHVHHVEAFQDLEVLHLNDILHMLHSSLILSLLCFFRDCSSIHLLHTKKETAFFLLVLLFILMLIFMFLHPTFDNFLYMHK